MKPGIVQLPVKQAVVVQSTQTNTQPASTVTKTILPVISTPQKSPLLKQRPLQKTEVTQSPIPVTSVSQQTTAPVVLQPTIPVSVLQTQNKTAPVTRSLLIRPPGVQSTVTATITTSTTQSAACRRGVVRVLSPATSAGKSLISPRALMQQGTTTANKKRTTIPSTASVTTIAQSTTSTTNVVSSVPTVVTSSVTTRTVQLAGGRTVQLASNQTVHLPGGQSVQLSAGHTLQLSSLQLPTHSVRLPSGQTVQLASPPTVQTVRAISTTSKSQSPRVQQTSLPVKNIQTSQIGRAHV